MLLHPSIRLYCERRRLSREAFLGAEFYVNIPEDLAAEAEATADDQVVEVGIEWATRQCEELLSGGAPTLHFYIMQRAYPVKKVVDTLRKMA